jgi:very-short-patch-repair endonuclease
MNPERREAQRQGGFARAGNLIPPEKTLKIREGEKYASLVVTLKQRGVLYEFEYRIGDVIFDLALLDRKLLVEFDGPYHTWKGQVLRDGEKDQIAKRNGWNLLRVVTETNNIPSDALDGIVT